MSFKPKVKLEIYMDFRIGPENRTIRDLKIKELVDANKTDGEMVFTSSIGNVNRYFSDRESAQDYVYWFIINIIPNISEPVYAPEDYNFNIIDID